MKKLNFYLIITCLFGLWIYACADTSKDDCTDDGCPEFISMMEELDAEFATYKVIPTITTETKDEFVYSLNQCITHLYKDVPIEKQIPRELIIAQADDTLVADRCTRQFHRTSASLGWWDV